MRVKLFSAFLATMLTIAAFCLLFIYADAAWDKLAFWTYEPARLYLYLGLGLLVGGIAVNVIIGNLLIGHDERLMHYIGITSLLGGGLLINIILIVIALFRLRANFERPPVGGSKASLALIINALVPAFMVLMGAVLLGIFVGLRTKGVVDWNPISRRLSIATISDARLALMISGGMLIQLGLIYSFVMGIIILANTQKKSDPINLVIGIAALCGGGLLINIVLPIQALRLARQNKENNNSATQPQTAVRSA